MLKIPALFVIVVAGISFIAWRGSAAEEDSYFNPYLTFKRAGQLYAESHFEEAIKDYQKIIEHGYGSGNLYYNLGNAYFKIGSLGQAVLNYERAKRLIPYDSDLRSNLEYAISLIEEPPMDRARLWLNRRMRNLLDSFTIDGLTKLINIIYLSVILLLTALIFKKHLRRLILDVVAVLAVVFMVALTLLSINICRIEYMRSAIVLAKEVNARFEPRENATVHFKLYAGSRISLIKTRDDWSQIKREDGKIGWVEASSYERI